MIPELESFLQMIAADMEFIQAMEDSAKEVFE